MKEEDLIRALEFITEGQNASLPEQLARETFSTESFKTSIEKVRKKSRNWTQGRGIQGIGIGEKISNGEETGEIVLRVYVEKKQPKSKLKNAVPSRVHVPEIGACETDVLEIGRVETEIFTSRQRPAHPGVGLGHFGISVGTFGCLVKKRGTKGPVYILSNSHVLAKSGTGSVGDVIIQQGRHDGGRRPADNIARLAQWIPFQFSASGYPNLVDAAIAKVKRSSVRPEIRIIGRAPIGVSNAIRRGMRVQKVGRTTDYTTGVVTDVNYRLFLRYPKPGGGVGRVGLRDQILCTRYTAGGDSGSAVLNRSGRVVGLHFAGSPSTSIFNRIKNVFQVLDIELA